MNRNSWKFSYQADELLKATTAKFEFHTKRNDWWTSKKAEVLSLIRAEGLEIDESVALGYSNTGRNTSVMIRDDLLRDLNECVSKITEHKGKVADYHAWIQVLQSQGKASFELNQDDWLFFFSQN